MKKTMIALILLALTSCAEENNTDQQGLIGTWDAIWEVDSEILNGKLVFVNNGIGYLNIPEKNNSSVLSEGAYVDFKWQKDGINFSITRLDNNLELKYEILLEAQNELYMIFVEGVYFKLKRRTE